MSVFPEESLVIVQAPGFYNQDEHGNPELLKLVLDACEQIVKNMREGDHKIIDI